MNSDSNVIPQTLRLAAGDWVQVRSKEEILSTLDKDGRLENLPVMPQMFQFCGRRLRVYKRAHKTCDTVNITGGRKMNNAVHLENIRCDGEAYGGCQAGCLIFWKEAWLKRVAGGDPSAAQSAAKPPEGGVAPSSAPGCTEAQVWAGTRSSSPAEDNAEEPVYVCQATQLPYATRPLPAWVVGQYIEDYTSGNVRLSQLFSSLLVFLYYQVAESGLGLGSAMRWLYSTVQKLRGGWPYPWYPGHLPKSSKTPSAKLNLQPGEWVTVKDQQEILKTVDEDLTNRGMCFHGEMVPYCRGKFRVLKRISQMINEKTGRMMKLKNECIVLEGADCVGRYTKPRFCPRGCYPYWREIWLERTTNDHADTVKNSNAAAPQ
jgi:hypothetical protein